MRKCPMCGGMMTKRTGSYKDDLIGLPNVTLVGVGLLKCKQCGETAVQIPRHSELLRLLAAHVITKPTRLSGEEIRFLRKHIGWDEGELAKHFGVDPATVSRWENNKEPIGPQTDRLLRMTVQFKSPLAAFKAEDLLNAIKKKTSESKPIRMIQRKREWKLAV